MINQAKSVNSPVTNPIDGNSISALILDDNQFDRMKIRRLFSTTGMPVHLNETDTLGALEEVLDQHDFDVILVDYNLTDSTGIEALDLVKNHPRNAKAPTIMITGYDQSSIAVEALKKGCVDYVSKGQLSAERLKTVVTEAIEDAEKSKSEGQTREEYAEELANTIMTEYSTRLQPELARVVRELRVLKASIGDPSSNLPADLEAVERRCIRLWAMLTRPQDLELTKAASQKLN